jgi:hypothetical protein
VRLNCNLDRLLHKPRCGFRFDESLGWEISGRLDWPRSGFIGRRLVLGWGIS